MIWFQHHTFIKEQKINKDASGLSYTMEQMDLTDIYRIFHPTASENTFLSACETFTSIDHISVHKLSGK